MNRDSIYISYSKLENVEVVVKFFCELFEAYISPTINIYSSIHEIGETVFDKCKIFVVILDSNYLSNKQCVEEYHLLQNYITQNGGVIIFIKIDKSNIDDICCIANKLYDFSDFDFSLLQNAKTKNALIPNAYFSYLNAFIDMAFEMKNLLKCDSVIETPENPIIYLSQSGEPPISCCLSLHREFLHRGYNILPQKQLNNPECVEEELNKILSEVRYAVLVIGDVHKISASQRCLIEAQHRCLLAHFSKLANEKCQAHYWIWCCSDVDIEKNEQREYVEQYQDAAKNQPLVDFLQMPIDVFKQMINSSLNLQSELVNVDKSVCQNLVYLICENNSDPEVIKLYKLLSNCGINPVLLQETENMNLQQVHRNLLLTCDWTIIYYSSGNKNWLKSKLFDLIKAPGFGRTKPNRNNIILNKSNKQIDFDLFEKMNYVGVAVLTDLTERDLRMINNHYE